jgi:hypothetical protein
MRKGVDFTPCCVHMQVRAVNAPCQHCKRALLIAHLEQVRKVHTAQSCVQYRCCSSTTLQWICDDMQSEFDYMLGPALMCKDDTVRYKQHFSFLLCCCSFVHDGIVVCS